MENLLLIGADIEIIELIEQTTNFKIIGIIDNNLKEPYYSHEILGTDQDAETIIKKLRLKNVVITLDSPQLKFKLFKFYNQIGLNFPIIQSNKSIISKYATISYGSIIQNGVNVGPNCKLGNCVKVNTNANIMHDARIGSFSTIAPNAITLGYVNVYECVFIGANATVLPNLSINKNSIVGAGSVVTKSISQGKIYAGNPARELLKK